MDPAGQAYPAVQDPVQNRVLHAIDAPYRPAGQGLQLSVAPSLNDPAGHTTAVALVLPAGQAYPGKHAPMQLASSARAWDPNRPGGQGPVQAGEGRADVDPYSPATQSTQAAAPLVL